MSNFDTQIKWALDYIQERYTDGEEGTYQEGMRMMSFSALEARAKEVAAAVESHAASIFHHGSVLLAKDIQDSVAKAKADALVAVKDKSPEIQAAVQLAVEALEKAALAAIESHLV